MALSAAACVLAHTCVLSTLYLLVFERQVTSVYQWTEGLFFAEVCVCVCVDVCVCVGGRRSILKLELQHKGSCAS